MHTDYHEAFWLSIAAATPVIALAFSLLVERATVLHRRYFGLSASLRNFGNTLEVPRGPDLARRLDEAVPPYTHYLWWLLSAALVLSGIVADLVSLTFSLLSLANERDEAPTTWIISLTVASAVALFAATAVVAIIGLRTDRRFDRL